MQITRWANWGTHSASVRPLEWTVQVSVAAAADAVDDVAVDHVIDPVSQGGRIDSLDGSLLVEVGIRPRALPG